MESQHNQELTAEAIEEAKMAISKVTFGVEEIHKWFERIDKSVDEIASKLGFEIPYGSYGSVSGNFNRYVTAYRVELLAKKIRES